MEWPALAQDPADSGATTRSSVAPRPLSHSETDTAVRKQRGESREGEVKEKHERQREELPHAAQVWRSGGM